MVITHEQYKINTINCAAEKAERTLHCSTTSREHLHSERNRIKRKDEIRQYTSGYNF